ncbi:cytochrome d ubiquinol oxidase subunit II [Tepidibacillus sp. HK-1]|uniref:cytochrome d ubiquinol oxidase subunit II n=1 Tax=Tepidibacillus sp. HK-1 TaxID=1883407 RepID=UPI0008530131|nr:cytochrome d ubiquinol oxidase subunit II [Tepidibacillus sp. HK-1]GBF10942.1 cytochrome bd-I ubiquinol oxidase subunit 2 [Tepidibacillus sp. HK-1]
MSYTALAITWFGLWGTLWAVYFMLDGFDLGVGILYPFIAKDDSERKLLLNTIGPFWDGNEVWLITAGGATFAAFPTTYALMFSYLYLPLMLILLGLIFRGTAIEFMNKSDHQSWRKAWKWAFFSGSLLVTLLFGVAFANIFQGLAMDDSGYHGTLLSLLNPYGLLGGLVFIALFSLTGAIWIAAKTMSHLSERALTYASKLWVIALILAGIFLIYTSVATNLYRNYLQQPILWIVPGLAVVALLFTRRFLQKKDAIRAFFASSVTILMTIYTTIIGLYPNMIPSSIDEKYSLTIFNSSSSEYTLRIMFYVAIIFVPIVIAYQIFVYKIFSDKVTEQDSHY